MPAGCGTPRSGRQINYLTRLGSLEISATPVLEDLQPLAGQGDITEMLDNAAVFPVSLPVTRLDDSFES